MNIPSTTSKRSFYILEIENSYKENQDSANNSRNRILEMSKRLDEVNKK